MSFLSFINLCIGCQYHPRLTTLKANSHIPCCSYAVPLPCRSTKALDCVFPIWFTQCARVWFTHAMPFPCHSPAVTMPCHQHAFLKGTSQGHGRFMAESRRQGDGMLTACWRLATPSSRKFVIRSIPIPDAVASVKQSPLGEWQGSGKIVAGSRQGNGMGTAWEQHGNGMVCVNPPLVCQVKTFNYICQQI
jgi:hypothetical protein